MTDIEAIRAKIWRLENELAMAKQELKEAKKMTSKTPVDEDPYYTTKDRKCKSCGEINTGSDTCSGPCGQCWACNCDCDDLTQTNEAIQ
jgi:hypothetical protein